MKTNIFSAIKLTLVLMILCMGVYSSVVWAMAQLAPNKGKGMMVTSNVKSYYSNIGESFTNDNYFNSRPSAVGYNAAGSGGSNKGPNNPDYLAQVQERIDTFLVQNPDIKKQEIPSDLITASGSGLDPNISVQAAKVQVKRIAKIRNINETELYNLINDCTEKPLLDLFGPEKINVLKLNAALDLLKK